MDQIKTAVRRDQFHTVFLPAEINSDRADTAFTTAIICIAQVGNKIILANKLAAQEILST